MVILVRRWAEAHMAEHPETRIQVTGGGSGTGLAALQNGTTDIAASSRPIERAEAANFIVTHGMRPREVAVAMDGIAVYVHRDNGVPRLSFGQLTAIFTGAMRDWAELGQPAGPIVAYTRENSSGTYAFFKEHVMGKRDFGATAQAMAGTAALINAVAKDARGIGYGGIGYHSGVRAVAVASGEGGPCVLPTLETVLSGEYPISRHLFFYVNPGALRAEVQRFMEWVAGSEGQRLVAEVGYYPLPGGRALAVREAAGSAGALSGRAPAPEFDGISRRPESRDIAARTMVDRLGPQGTQAAMAPVGEPAGPGPGGADEAPVFRLRPAVPAEVLP